MSDNLNRNDVWARWRWTMDSLFSTWPIIAAVTQGQRVVLQACRVSSGPHPVNDNEPRK